jgi:hypothetical protein
MQPVNWILRLQNPQTNQSNPIQFVFAISIFCWMWMKLQKIRGNCFFCSFMKHKLTIAVEISPNPEG